MAETIKTVFNIGYFGNGKYKKSTHLKFYNFWQQMLRRCYDKKYHLTRPTYIDCIVDERWHNFQVFAEWCENNYITDFCLDKDILFKGNKIYGPDTCCFVPQEINSAFNKSKITRGIYPIGVSLHGKNFRITLSKFGNKLTFGTYQTIEEAFKIYKIEKEKYSKELAEIWKDKILEKTYNSLINYQVEITD